MEPKEEEEGMKAHFDHERLEVYQVARDLNREIGAILTEIPRGHADSRDQLKRSSKSITRNIAEGSGKWLLKDKIHYYHIARGSATEAAATLDELVDFGLLLAARIEHAKDLLGHVVAMLIGMIRSLERREGIDMSG